METRANYILIGAFTLAGLLGIVGFFLWFARIELDRQFDYYQIDFTSVSGLSNASDVRFSGLPVGQVVSVALSPTNDGTIRVQVEVNAETPVRTDSVATIEAQGVTGVSFVQISPGTPDADLLAVASSESIPQIPSERSALQRLTEDAPKILEETLAVLEGVSGLLTQENRNRIDTTLSNVEDASGQFAAALEDFSSVTSSVSEFAGQIDNFNTTLEDLTGSASTVFGTADETLASIGTLAEDARGTLTVLNQTIARSDGLLTEAERFIANDLSTTTQDVSRVVGTLGTQIEVISTDTQTMLAAVTTTGTTATQRLTEAQATLAAADRIIARFETTLATLDTTAGNIDTLVTGDVSALVTDARAAMVEATAAIEIIGTAAETDLPRIVSDLRQTSATVARVTEEVGENLSSATGRIDALTTDTSAMVSQVTTTFADANETLTAINGALETGSSALSAVERAFGGADDLINAEGAALVADLRGTVAQLDAAIAQVAADIPAVSANLQAASVSAQETFASLGRIVANTAGPVETFAEQGLPDYTRLAQEARIMIKPNALQAQYLPSARWSDAAPVMLQTLMLRSVQSTDAFSYVGRQPLGARGDYAVLTELVDFQTELDAAGQTATVRLGMTVRVLRETDNRIIASRNFSASAIAPSTETLALVAGFDAAAANLLPAFTSWTLSVIAAN